MRRRVNVGMSHRRGYNGDHDCNTIRDRESCGKTQDAADSTDRRQETGRLLLIISDHRVHILLRSTNSDSFVIRAFYNDIHNQIMR